MDLKKLRAILPILREQGVTRYRDGDFEIEILPDVEKLYANPSPEAEGTKAPTTGLCIYPGCTEKSGWKYNRAYCRAHGLKEHGVQSGN